MSAAFTVNPDFEIIRKYYFIGYNDVELDQAILEFKNNGCQYSSHMGDNEQQRIEFEEKFLKIVEENGVDDHYQNLLYVCLHLYERNWDTVGNIFVNLPYLEKGKEYLQERDFPEDLKDRLRANQLAKLLLNINGNNYPEKISFQHKDSDSNIIRDELLRKWICDLVVDSIERGKFPANFGAYISSFIWDSEKSEFGSKLNLEMVKEEAETNPIQILGLRNDAICRFILLIHEFVHGENLFEGKKAVKFSNKQLSLYLDLAKLFKLFHPDQKRKYIKDSNGYDSEDMAVFSKLLRDYLKKHLK